MTHNEDLADNVNDLENENAILKNERDQARMNAQRWEIEAKTLRMELQRLRMGADTERINRVTQER